MRNQLNGSKEKWRKGLDTANHVLRSLSLPVDVFRFGGVGLRYEANNPLYIAGAAIIALAVAYVHQNGLLIWADNTDFSLTILPPHEQSAIFLAFVSLFLSIALHNTVSSFYRTVIQKQSGYSKEKGVSFVSLLFPNLQNGQFFLEAAFWLSIGFWTTKFDPLTGWYICVCSLALLCRLAIEYGIDTRRRIAIDDLITDGSNIRPNIKGGNHR